MTTIDEANGHVSEKAARLDPKTLPDSLPVWGTPPAPTAASTRHDGERGAEPFEGLQAGDELEPVTHGPVEQHLIAVKPDRKDRLARLLGDEPILPPWMRDAALARQKAVRGRRIAGRGALIGLVNSWMVFRVAFWVLRGLLGWLRRLLRWGLDIDSDPLSGTIQAKDQVQYDRAVVLRSRRQKFRFQFFAVVGAVAAAVMVALWMFAAWVVVALALVVLALAGRAGMPENVKILSPGIRRHVVPRITCALVARALAEVADDKTAKAIRKDSDELWRSGFVDVPHGVRIQIVLPGAATASSMVPHEQRIASALGRPEDCAIVEPLPHVTTGHFNLYIFDKPVLGGAPVAGPLVKAKRTSFFKPVEIGRTRTGRPHREHLYGGAWFIGAKPNYGKSSLAMVALGHAILDPYTIPIVVNLKAGGDYVWAKTVCHTYINGAPEIDRTVIARFHALVEWLMAEAGRRGEFLTRLVEQGKTTETNVTEELARRYQQLRPIIAIFDEIHRAFDERINPNRDEFTRLLADLIKACRFVGITIICVTQLAGRDSIDPALTRGARLRACLRVSEATSFRQIMGDLGAGAFDRLGIGRLPAGTAVINSDEGDCVKIGVHYLKDHLREIGKRALALRQSMHTLAGQAAGENLALEVADPADLLTHLLQAIPSTAPAGGPDDNGVAWVAELEAVLGRREEYTGRAAGWLPAELKARQVATGQLGRRGKEYGPSGQRNHAGVRAADVRTALERLLGDT